MDDIKNITRNGSWDVIATLLVAVAFGWRNATAGDTVEVEEEIPFVLTDQDHEIPGLFVNDGVDTEVEREYVRIAYVADKHGHPSPVAVEETDDGASVDQPYWTRSGDNPVIHDQGQQADAVRSAAGFMPEQVKDLTGKPYTSTAKWGKGKVQERNFHAVLRFVRGNQDNTRLLQAGWKRMWKRIFEQSNHGFLFPSQVKTLQGEFRRLGIVTKKEAAATK